MNDQLADRGCPHAELAVGWVLHALEPAEESFVLAHLPDCEECTQAVIEAEMVSAALGASLPQVEPDPRLEQRILAAAVDPAATSESASGSASESASVSGSASVSESAPIRLADRRAARSRRRLPRILAAAAAVVLVSASAALGIRVVQLEDQRAQAAERLAEVSSAMQRAAQPGVSRVALATPDGRGVGLMLASAQGTEFVATDLPGNNRSEQIYVLWGLRGGTPTALAGFDVAPDGPVAHPVPSLSGGAGAFTGYAVSLERGRELPQSPTKVLASGRVES